jgi:hypothetical protein
MFSSIIKKSILVSSLLAFMQLTHAEKLSVNQPAPLFELHAQDGSTLDFRKSQGEKLDGFIFLS